MPLSSIHPFPARMAPELAREFLESVPKGGRAIDPMCGSGTVVRFAVEAGFDCVGADIDPLAVLMTRVWTTRLDADRLRIEAEEAVRTAKALSPGAVERTSDPETRRFVSYWFAPRQEAELARLATALRQRDDPFRDALAVALSRIVISKEMKASLARDTSHSRPHRVSDVNDFDAYAGFLRSARQVASRLEPELVEGAADIRQADARTLDDIDDRSFDLALTSPPYLNAIDYLRGHRLALVWLGYDVGPLRKIRAANVGAEKSKADAPIDVAPFVVERNGCAVSPRHMGWIRRYASDMDAILRQLRRVVKRSGRVVLVLGNSFLRGAAVNNAGLVESVARQAGFRIVEAREREIPARRRYLPPPGSGQGALDSRMRTETVLVLS